MTQKAVSFNELMEGVLDQLRANGYMESTITIYRRTYTRIRVFLNRFDTDFYTPKIGTKFLAETNVKKSTASAYACAIRRLNDFIDSKPFRSQVSWKSSYRNVWITATSQQRFKVRKEPAGYFLTA